MSVLDVFRTTVAAAALGFARRALDEAPERVSSRHVQGAPLFDLQMVQGHIAEMALDVDASALLVYRAAWMRDSGAARVTREAAMAKLFATDQAQTVIDKAVQLFGGDGVRSGTTVEKLYREIRALRIYEGQVMCKKSSLPAKRQHHIKGVFHGTSNHSSRRLAASQRLCKWHSDQRWNPAHRWPNRLGQKQTLCRRRLHRPDAASLTEYS